MSETHPSVRSQDQFDRQAALYATSAVHKHGPSLPILVEFAAPTSADLALDIATGTGNTAIAIAASGADVVGVDLSTGMLEKARVGAEGMPNVRFEVGDAEELPFADGSFSLVTARHAPHHFRNVAKFLSEVRRVLAPGGRFVMADGISPDAASHDWLNRWQRTRDRSHFEARTVEQWRDLAGAAGFIWVREEFVGYRLEFPWWVRQSGCTPETIEELKRMAREAPEPVREACKVELDENGDPIAFTDPMLVVRLTP